MASIHFVIVVTALAAIDSVMGTAELMSKMTVHFGKSLEQCREEANLSPEIMKEFHDYWREDFEVVHRELGCAIICMSNKFNLVEDNNKLHHANMHDYIKSFPGGDALSAKMVTMIHTCEKQYDDIEDDCSRVVKIAACFKQDAKKDGIAPDIAMIEAVLEKY